MEYSINAGWGYPSFLFMCWPSRENGYYTFQVEIYDEANNNIKGDLPTDKNYLTIRVDNTPLDVSFKSI